MSLGPGVTAEMGPAAIIKPQRQGGNAVARSHRLRCPSVRRKSDRQNVRERYIGEVVAAGRSERTKSPVLFPRVGRAVVDNFRVRPTRGRVAQPLLPQRPP
jgi:hypothetical protein